MQWSYVESIIGVVILIFGVYVVLNTSPTFTILSFVVCSVVLIAVLIVATRQKEAYSKMDVFPWNEANLVIKRNPQSTVIDCEWDIDRPDENNIFCDRDKVVSRYNTDS